MPHFLFITAHILSCVILLGYKIYSDCDSYLRRVWKPFQSAPKAVHLTLHPLGGVQHHAAHLNQHEDDFFQKLQLQMTMGHQPNTHSASEVNLAAYIDFSAALTKQLLVYFEVLCCLLVPRRIHFVLAFCSACIANGAVISRLTTLNTWHCNPMFFLGNSGLRIVSSYLC